MRWGQQGSGATYALAPHRVRRQRIATPQGDYAATLDAVVALVSGLESEVGAECSVGIGMPGSVSRATGRVKNSNSVCLNGQPLHRELETRLGRPLRFANDADCFALSEATDGAGREAADCLCFCVSDYVARLSHPNSTKLQVGKAGP